MSSIYKTLALVFIGILLAGFLIWRWVQKSKDFTPIEPTNIFKSIEYVEELRLTTFFFEELLILGTPDNVKQIRDNLLIEVEELNDEERKRAFFVKQASTTLAKIDSQILKQTPELEQATGDIQALKALIAIIPRRAKKQHELLKTNSNVFGENVKKAFEQYEDAIDKLENRISSDRVPLAQRKANVATTMSWLDAAIEKEKNLRKNTLTLKEEAVKRLKKDANKDSKQLESDKKEAEKIWKKAKKSLREVKEKINSKEAELERAENELAWVIANQGDTIKPKLMIIAEAQLSGYVNLKDLKINRRPFDDTLEVYVPRPQLDSVIVRIEDDSTRLYQLARPAREKVSNEGAYYDIFQQLKNAIILAEGRVKQRAYEAGIIEETHRLAKEYVEQFATNLNLPVVFKDSVEALSLILPLQPKEEPQDTIPAGMLDSHNTLDNSALKERTESLPDSATLDSLLKIE